MKVIFWLTGICLLLFGIFYLFHGDLLRKALSNKVVVTTQGQFSKASVQIKLVQEGVSDTLIIYENERRQQAFQLEGHGQFLVYDRGLLIAEFEHVKFNPNIGNTYHFYLSANKDSLYADMRVEGVGSGR